MPPKVEYSLTPRGRSLEPVITALKVWGDANVTLAPKEFRRLLEAEAWQPLALVRPVSHRQQRVRLYIRYRRIGVRFPDTGQRQDHALQKILISGHF